MRDKFKFLFEDKAIFIILFAVTLYGLGRAFHMGRLAFFGINDSLFPIDLDQSMFFGFISIADFILVPLFLLCAAWGMVFCLEILNRPVVKFFFMAMYKKVKFLVPVLDASVPKTEILLKTEKNLERVGYLSLIIVFVIFLLFIVSGVADAFGRNHGKDEKKEWDAILMCHHAKCDGSKKLKFYKPDIFELNIKGNLIQYNGFLIEGNSHYIAIYTQEKGSIIIPASELIMQQINA